MTTEGKRLRVEDLPDPKSMPEWAELQRLLDAWAATTYGPDGKPLPPTEDAPQQAEGAQPE